MNQFIVGVLIAIILSACGQNASKQKEEEGNILIEQQIRGEAQGTTYTLKYIGEEQKKLKSKVDSLLAAIDQSMSTYIEESTISRLNRSDSVQVDSMFKTVFIESKRLSELTNGAFDPTIAPLIEAWGFDFSDPRKMDSSEVIRLKRFCGFDQFMLKEDWLVKNNPKAKLNFNAVAQGYSVDLMAQLLRDHNIEHYFVELGGEVIVKGKNKDDVLWRVGIDQPSGMNLERALSAIVSLEDESMVTSGNYRKFIEIEGKKYSHTLDPKSGFPVKQNLLSATVIAKNSMTADALATACMVMGLEKAKEFLKSNPDYYGILIYSNKEGNFKTYYSSQIADRIEEL